MNLRIGHISESNKPRTLEELNDIYVHYPCQRDKEGEPMTKITLNTRISNICGHVTSHNNNGSCVTCTRRMAAEIASRDGTYAKACDQCDWSGFIAPSGDQGFLCPNCGSKIGG